MAGNQLLGTDPPTTTDRPDLHDVDPIAHTASATGTYRA